MSTHPARPRISSSDAESCRARAHGEGLLGGAFLGRRRKRWQPRMHDLRQQEHSRDRQMCSEYYRRSISAFTLHHVLVRPVVHCCTPSASRKSQACPVCSPTEALLWCMRDQALTNYEVSDYAGMACDPGLARAGHVLSSTSSEAEGAQSLLKMSGRTASATCTDGSAASAAILATQLASVACSAASADVANP